MVRSRVHSPLQSALVVVTEEVVVVGTGVVVVGAGVVVTVVVGAGVVVVVGFGVVVVVVVGLGVVVVVVTVVVGTLQMAVQLKPESTFLSPSVTNFNFRMLSVVVRSGPFLPQNSPRSPLPSETSR